MRVLHLVECFDPSRRRPSDASADASVLACRAASESLSEFSHEVWLMADSAGERRARELGLCTPHRVSAPLGYPPLAWPALRALAATRDHPDVIQCWCASSARSMRRAFGGRVPVLAAGPDLPTPAGVNGTDRARLRLALDLDDSTAAVLLLADPAGFANAQQFAFLAGLLEFASVRATCVIPAGASAQARSRAYHRRGMLECRMIFSSLPALSLANACDLGILHTPHDGVEGSAASLPYRRSIVRAAHRAGLPVVVPPGAGVDDLGRAVGAGGSESLVARSAKPADIAKIAVPLLKDRARLRGIAAALPGAVADAPDEVNALQSLRRSWAQAAGATTGVNA